MTLRFLLYNLQLNDRNALALTGGTPWSPQKLCKLGVDKSLVAWYNRITRKVENEGIRSIPRWLGKPDRFNVLPFISSRKQPTLIKFWAMVGRWNPTVWRC